jgi:hypothetical protein
LEAERLALETENMELKVNKDEIESYRRFIKILELQKAELVNATNSVPSVENGITFLIKLLVAKQHHVRMR